MFEHLYNLPFSPSVFHKYYSSLCGFAQLQYLSPIVDSVIDLSSVYMCFLSSVFFKVQKEREAEGEMYKDKESFVTGAYRF